MTDTTTRSVLLVVEDDAALARAFERGLEDDFDAVVVVGTAREADIAVEADRGDIQVVLTDVHLPDGDGLDLVAHLRSTHPTIGAVVVTGLDADDVANRAVELGVQGYLQKPCRLNEVRINVANARRWRALENENRGHRDRLQQLVEAKTADLAESRWETIHRLSIAAEARDDETGDHLERMSAYSSVLARRAGLARADCEEIRVAAPMHDIGKIAIPDAVLRHDGPFEPWQREVMQQHTIIGHGILEGSSSSLLRTGAEIARSHHEWFDGSGYPDGIQGSRIPLAARIVAIADVFDALMSKRRYKAAMGVQEVVAIMRSESGTHFDPHLLGLFLSDIDELVFIRDAFSGDTVLT